jgi:hypothetical protein
MRNPRYVDRVSMTGFGGFMPEIDTVYLGEFRLMVGRNYTGIASAINVFAPNGEQIIRGYRTGMGKFTLFDWRNGYKHHHSFELWMSIFTYLLGVIDVWESRYGKHATESR